MKLACDAFVQALAQELQIAEEGAAAEGEAGHHFLRALAHGVAAGDELLILSGEFLQAGVEEAEAFVEAGFDVAALAGEEVHDVLAEEQWGARGLLAVFLYLEIGEAVGPGEEGASGVVLGEFAIEGETCFLQDVAGICLARDEAEDVTKQWLLMLGEQQDEGFGGGGRVWHGCSVFPVGGGAVPKYLADAYSAVQSEGLNERAKTEVAATLSHLDFGLCQP